MVKRKKVLAVLTALVACTSFSVFAAAPYTDLGGLKSRVAIDYLYDNNCLSFAPGTTFSPQQVLTRGDLAQLIYGTALNLPTAPLNFTDAPSPKANDAMAAVASHGILEGYADGSFKPDQPVTREEFAAVLYQYLKYCGLTDVSRTVAPYADQASIDAADLEAVQYLHNKNLMLSADNLFRPKDGITRAEAAETMYHVSHSDGDYVSHVDVERQVIRALNAEYGSMPAYFQQGTLYWDGNKLVLGMKTGPHMFPNQRLKRDVSRYDVLEIRPARFARSDYDQLMMRAINCIVSEEGVQNYIGAMPDYKAEQIDVIVRRPLAASTLQKLEERVGKGIVRIRDLQTIAAAKPAVQAGDATDEDLTDTQTNTDRDGANVYSPLYDTATNKAVDSVIQDTIK